MEQNDNDKALESMGAVLFLSHAKYRLIIRRLKVYLTQPLPVLVYAALIVVFIVIGSMAYKSTSNTLWQSFYIEIAAGGITFVLFPLIYWAARTNSYITYGTVFTLIVFFTCLSYFTLSVTQSFFVEAAAGLALLLALDFGLNYIVKLIEKVKEDADQELRFLQQEIEEAKEALSGPFYFAMDGGTTGETVQFNLVLKHVEICQTLCSDEPYRGDDLELISVIKRVNDFKKNDPDEFGRIMTVVSNRGFV